MSKKLNNGWTCIDDVAPPKDCQILVINERFPGCIVVGERRENELGAYVVCDRRPVYPTHWRYLPEPPEYRGGGEDE